MKSNGNLFIFSIGLLALFTGFALISAARVRAATGDNSLLLDWVRNNELLFLCFFVSLTVFLTSFVINVFRRRK
jgi:hypothetical protein